MSLSPYDKLTLELSGGGFCAKVSVSAAVFVMLAVLLEIADCRRRSQKNKAGRMAAVQNKAGWKPAVR